MFAPNFNSNFQQSFQIQQTQFVNSVGSNSSIGSSSFLAAANTIILNGSGSSSSPSNFPNQQSQSNSQITPSSLAKSKQSNLSNSKFSNSFLQLQQQQASNQNDLDFDLHNINYNVASSLNDQNSSLLKKKKSNSSVGQVLFKDDDNLFDEDSTTDNDIDEEELDYELEDDFSNESIKSSNRMQTTLTSIQNENFKSALKSNISQLSSSSNPGKMVTMNMPIEQVNKNELLNQNVQAKKSDSNNVNLVNSFKRPTFFNQNSLTNGSLSPSSHLACASITPTANMLTDATPQNSVKYSRTLMKQQLMKQQTEEMERKAAAHLSHLSNNSLGHNETSNNIITNNNNNNINNSNNPVFYLNASPLDNTSISLKNENNMPSSLTSSEIIPKSVVSQFYKIETKLENPTKYHVMQIAKNLQQSTNQNETTSSPTNKTKRLGPKATRQRLGSNKSNTSKPSQYQQQFKDQLSFNEARTDKPLSSIIEIANNNSSISSDYYMPGTVSSHHSFDSQSSNFDSTRLTSPTNSSFSQNELDELEDIVPDELNLGLSRRSYSSHLTSLQIQNEINQIEQVLNLPKTLPNDGYLKVMTPPLTPSVRPSSSCPADIARLKKLQGVHLTEDEIKLIIKDRQKKDNHNMIERRRRFNINDRIKELGTILPKSNQSDKQNKGSILKASVDYIKNLQNELNKTQDLEEKLSQMTILNRKLMEKIKSLENANNELSRSSSLHKSNSSLINLINSPSIITNSPYNQQKSFSLPQDQANNGVNIGQNFIILQQNQNMSQQQMLQLQLQKQQQQQQQQQIQQQQQQQMNLNFGSDLNIKQINHLEQLIAQEESRQQTNQIKEYEIFSDANLMNINDSKTLEELLQNNSSITNQENDPILMNPSNLFDDNIMDSFN